MISIIIDITISGNLFHLYPMHSHNKFAAMKVNFDMLVKSLLTRYEANIVRITAIYSIIISNFIFKVNYSFAKASISHGNSKYGIIDMS